MYNTINIIYYIWINPNRNWKVIIDGQLDDIKSSGILDCSKLYIIVCNENETILDEASTLINISLQNIDKTKYNIETTKNNFYEYYGIKKLYDLSKEEPDKLYIYLHSKGMFHWYNNENVRSSHEVYLTQNIINLWKDILYIFNENPEIKKIGSFPSYQGWMWFNFFWVRGSYLITCEEPIITERFYYEGWLGTGNKNDSDSLSIYSKDDRKFSPEEAMDTLNYESFC